MRGHLRASGSLAWSRSLRPVLARGCSREPAAGGRVRRGVLFNLTVQKKEEGERKEERKVPHYCHCSSGPCGALSGSSLPWQSERPGSGRATTPSVPAAAGGAAGPGPARPSSARPRCERSPSPHPTRANRPRAGQLTAKMGGRRPWPTDAKGGPEPSTPGCCLPPLFVYPCPPQVDAVPG